MLLHKIMYVLNFYCYNRFTIVQQVLIYNNPSKDTILVILIYLMGFCNTVVLEIYALYVSI